MTDSSMPLDFSGYIAERTGSFVGREWVLAEIDRWLADPGAPRFLVITGSPGSGKTAIAGVLTRVRDLAAYHFCRVDQRNTLDPRTFCESLALQLANRYPEFERTLAEMNGPGHITVTQIHDDAAQTRPILVQQLRGNRNPRDLCDRVLRRPLGALADELPAVPLVILVDGIDEAMGDGREAGIIDLLADADDLPVQVRFLLTSRLGPHLNRFRKAHYLSLDDRAAETAADLQAYAEQYLASRIAGPQESPADRLVERVWVWQRIEAWLAKETRPFFLLSGPPGSGKSTLVWQLEQTDLAEHREVLPRLTQTWTYFHACRAGDDATLDPLRFLQGLASALAGHFPAYGEALTRIDPTSQIQVNQTVGTAESGARVVGVSIGTLSIGDLNPRTAFEHVLRQPLEQLCTDSFTDTILITVDALDEAQGYADNALGSLISHFVQPEARWPAQVRWMLTSRPDTRIIHLFGQPALDLVADAPGDDDVYLYAHDRLDILADPDRDTLARRVAEAAKGIFLYARYALDDAVQQIQAGRPWNDLELPAGLGNWYSRFLRRELAKGLTDWQRDYRPLLGCLAAAQGSGLTRRQLAGITGKDADALLHPLTASAQYLEGAQPDGPFHIYHQSFRDFLTEDKEFGIDLSGAHQKIAQYFVLAYTGEWAECQDAYALQYTPVHLIEAMRHLPLDADPLARRELAARIRELAADPAFWQSRESGALAAGGAYDNVTLRAMLDIWSHYREAKTLLLPLLGILSAARAPLAAQPLADIARLESANLLDGLRILRPYLAGDDASGFALFQKSLAAYLESNTQNEHGRLAEHYLDRCAGRWSECDSYGLCWLITHLVGGKLWQGLAATLGDTAFWQARLERVGLPAAAEDVRGAAELAPATGALRANLARLLETLGMLTPSTGEAASLDTATTVQAIRARVKELGLDQPQNEVLTSPVPADLVARIVERSAGNFLYVRMALQALEQEPSLMAAFMQDLPADLASFYRLSLHRLMQEERIEQWRRNFRSILGILAVAREPLSASQLAALAGINGSDVHEVLRRLLTWLTVQTQDDDRRYLVFHQSFQEFLTDRQASLEFWADPIRFHLRIAGYYQKFAPDWQACDAYGLRNTVTHFERAALGSAQPERHTLVEQLVRVALDLDFQRAHEDRLHDPFGLAGDLALATAAAVRDEHPWAPLVVVPAALGWAAFRGRKLNPGMLFELAGEGQASTALSNLDLYPAGLEWDLAARWLIAWFGVDATPSLAGELVTSLTLESPAEGPLHLLGLRVRAVLDGSIPDIPELPPPPPREVARALANMGGPVDNELLEVLLPTLPLDSEPVFLADTYGPLLVAYATAHPSEGAELLRRFVALHDGYAVYRQYSLWRLLDAVLCHPDPAWARTLSAEIVAAALEEPDVEFREGLGLTVLALQARAGQPGAQERLEELGQAALSEAPASDGGRPGGDPWAHHLRRLAALAESQALVFGNLESAAALVGRAQALGKGYAGFMAPALIELAGTMLLCGMPGAAIRDVLQQARTASHNIQDFKFCARSSARWNVLSRDWPGDGRDLAATIRAFADEPGAPEFAAVHGVGEAYPERASALAALPLPERLLQANSLSAVAQAFERSLSSVRRFNPGWDPEAELPHGMAVRLPDPGLAPHLAARLACFVLADLSRPATERAWLIQQLVPAAAGSPTALDAVLSRLLLAARPDDLHALESVLTT